MVQGHAHDVISKAVTDRIGLGTHFAAPTEDAIVVGEELRGAGGSSSGASSTPAPRRRWTRSGSRGRHGPRHDREDLRLLPRAPRLRDGLARRRLRLDRRPFRPAVDPLRARHPAGRRGHDDRGPVQRRGGDGAPNRAPDRGGSGAGLRDHGGRDDESRRRPAGAGLPRGRPRDHEGSTASCSSSTRSRPASASPPAAPSRSTASCPTWSHLPRRSAAVSPRGAIGGTAEVFEKVESGEIVQVGTYNGNPLSMAAARANLARGHDAGRVRPPRHAQRAPARRLPGRDREVRVPGLLGRGRLEGLRTFSPEKITDYESFKANQDEELCSLAWLYNMNRGIFMTPGSRGGVDALDHAHDRGLQHVRGGVRRAGRDLTSLTRLGRPRRGEARADTSSGHARASSSNKG